MAGDDLLRLTFSAGPMEDGKPAVLISLARFFKKGKWMDDDTFGEALAAMLKGVESVDACPADGLTVLAHAVDYLSRQESAEPEGAYKGFIKAARKITDPDMEDA